MNINKNKGPHPQSPPVIALHSRRWAASFARMRSGTFALHLRHAAHLAAFGGLLLGICESFVRQLETSEFENRISALEKQIGK